jgi:Glycosyltransferases involved in cell wall biogenesis
MREVCMTAISVIVPLHNSKKYLVECLDSILVQTLKDIEIICVDSSTDETTGILYQYQSRDSRIQIIEDANSSYGHKLNVGIQRARGEYIAIVESDDYIAEDMMEKLYDVVHKYNLDFAKSNYEGFIDAGDSRLFSPFERVNDSEYNRVIHLRDERNFMVSVGYNIWTGIYRTSFLHEKKIQFHESEGASYQDVGFANLVTLAAERTCFLKEYLYKYRMDNEGSSVKSDHKYKCIAEEFVWLKQQMERLGYTSKTDCAFFGIAKLHSYYWNYLRLSRKYQKKLLAETQEMDLGAFDESLLNYSMPNKEHILSLYNGDKESEEQEKRLEKRKETVYRELLHIGRKGLKLIIVGAGTYGQSVYRFMKMIGTTADLIVCDNHVQGKVSGFDETPVISVYEAVQLNREGYYIVANKMYAQELGFQLRELGIFEDQIYICNYIMTGRWLFSDFMRYCGNEKIQNT